MSVGEIKAAALALPPEARAELMDELAASFGGAEIDQAWREEICQRVDELDKGLVTPIPAEEVFAKARTALGV